MGRTDFSDHFRNIMIRYKVFSIIQMSRDSLHA